MDNTKNGDNMTKIVKPILSFLFVIVLIFQYYVFINNDNKTTMVFSETTSDINDYSDYLVDFKDTLSSKFFNEKFSVLEKNKYQIKKLYLSVKETWNEKVKEQLSEYSFDNIENFVSRYKNILQKNNLSDEIPNIDISGIIINKVLIYTSKEEIEKLKQQYNIEYQKK